MKAIIKDGIIYTVDRDEYKCYAHECENNGQLEDAEQIYYFMDEKSIKLIKDLNITESCRLMLYRCTGIIKYCNDNVINDLSIVEINNIEQFYNSEIGAEINLAIERYIDKVIKIHEEKFMLEYDKDRILLRIGGKPNKDIKEDRDEINVLRTQRTVRFTIGSDKHNDDISIHIRDNKVSRILEYFRLKNITVTGINVCSNRAEVSVMMSDTDEENILDCIMELGIMC